MAPIDALRGIEPLFQTEHVHVEVLLQLLIREVDAELFEGIPFEDFEAVDVQQTDLVHFLLAPVSDTSECDHSS